MSNRVVALAVSDLHLSHKAPIARSCEPSWYAVMERQIAQLHMMQSKYDFPPILAAGDIFDKWNSPPELINFAIEHLPVLYAVPGNHDLPLHNTRDLNKSAYWTLVQAGKICNLPPAECEFVKADILVYGFPHGFEIKSPKEETTKLRSQCLKIAVVHDYIWQSEKSSFPGALPENHVTKWGKSLEGCDVAIFGDNHKGFIEQLSDPCVCICNTGTFFRRNSDERKYKPFVGVIYSNGSIEKEHLDCRTDKFLPISDMTQIQEDLDATELIEELSSIDSDVLDFHEAVIHYLGSRRVSERVKKLVLEALESTGP